MSFILVRPFYRIKYTGRKNVPEGAFVLASNHISYFDPVCLGMGFRRRINFMAKSGLFEEHGALAGKLLRSCGVFPVVRGTADRKAVSRAEELLSGGRIVGIFPQGGIRRREDGFEAKAGAALLASKAGVPLLPVYIGAEGRIRPFVKISVRIGEPLVPEGTSLRAARELNRRFTAEMNLLAQMYDQAEEKRRSWHSGGRSSRSNEQMV